VLTHCNAGALCACGWGTALGVIRSAVADGKKIKVFVDETRPRQQGARLTCWELLQDKIDTTLIADTMAAHLMRVRQVDAVIVGADRIAANGDAANKIGTYGLAIIAKAHGVPFYVAAPLSTIDPDTPTGADIPIEERGPEEVTTINDKLICPPEVQVFNPAFDVTPAELIEAIITEYGVLTPPYAAAIKTAFSTKPLRD
jgi:methylthioribose-1-phosphate isomerase